MNNCVIVSDMRHFDMNTLDEGTQYILIHCIDKLTYRFENLPSTLKGIFIGYVNVSRVERETKLQFYFEVDDLIMADVQKMFRVSLNVDFKPLFLVSHQSPLWTLREYITITNNTKSMSSCARLKCLTRFKYIIDFFEGSIYENDDIHSVKWSCCQM